MKFVSLFLSKLFSIRIFYTFGPTQSTARFLDEYGEANLTNEMYTTANCPRKSQLRGTYTVWGKLCSNVIVFCVKRITRRLKIYPKIFSSPSWSRNRMVECISSRFQTYSLSLSLSLSLTLSLSLSLSHSLTLTLSLSHSLSLTLSLSPSLSLSPHIYIYL